MELKLPNPPEFVDIFYCKNILDEVYKETDNVSKLSDDERYNLLIGYADSKKIGFAFTFYYYENCAIEREKEYEPSDIEGINSSHRRIKSYVSRKLNDYLLSHNGEIDSWPYPYTVPIHKLQRHTSSEDDSLQYDSRNYIYFDYNYFYSQYVSKTETFTSEHKFRNTIEITTNTYVDISKADDGFENPTNYLPTENEELAKMESELSSHNITIKYHHESVKEIRANNFKKTIALIPAVLIIINALAILYWSLSGKQGYESLTLMQYILQFGGKLNNEIVQVISIIILLPTLLCAFFWNILNFIPSPFNIIARFVVAAIIIALALGLNSFLKEKLNVKKNLISIKELKARYSEARNRIVEISSDSNYRKLDSIYIKNIDECKKVFSKWSDTWYRYYKAKYTNSLFNSIKYRKD
ncbi:MAG: hypothetical protein E7564_07360 [Ruminococcaceae bacterium]|nr:hypothetical protein [Oscillospiraceae bacterium]